jgi:hypothetical protein
MEFSSYLSHIYRCTKSKRIMWGVFLSMLIFVASACQPAAPACPPESVTYLDNLSQLASVQPVPNGAGQLVEINGKEIWVDQVVQGMLCRGSWSGTVYVPCQVQVYAWEENPLFLENCDLHIAPGTIVYGAAHNNEAYYQGCSCHTGDALE